LADVAAPCEGPYHQRVVDILCGYLRTDRLLKDANGDTRYATNDDGTPNYDQPLSEDGAVESTILSVLASHLRTFPENSLNKSLTYGPWSHYNIDLHNAHLTESAVFEDTFIGMINATGAHFSQPVKFRSCVFRNSADFLQAKFVKEADFKFSTFAELAAFSEVIFKEDANFQSSVFNSAQFTRATFSGEANFGGVLTERERGTQFLWEADFRGATFMGIANFGGWRIPGERHRVVSFGQNAYFNDCTFMGIATFQNTNFGRLVSFGDDSLGEGLYSNHLLSS